MSAQPATVPFDFCTIESRLDTRPSRHEATFESLAEYLRTHVRMIALTRAQYLALSKPEQAQVKDGPAIILARFKRDGVRTDDEVLYTTGIGLDVDEAHIELDELRALLAGTAAIIYESANSTANARRWRVLIPFTDVAKPDEHERAFEHWSRIIPGVGAASRNPSRLWYGVTQFAKEPKRIFEVLPGDAFNVLSIARTKRTGREAFLAHVKPPADEPAAEGARNAQLSRYALSVLRECSDEADLYDRLSAKNEEYSPPLDDREVRAMARAKWKRRAKFGWSADDVEVRIEQEAGSPDEPAEEVDESYAPYLDWQALAANPPEPKREVLGNWLYAGTVALFAGHGGVGKSFIGLQMAVHLALGIDVLGKRVQRERVIYYSCEDDADTVYWRAQRICKSLGRRIEELDDALLVRDFTQSDAIMYSDERGVPTAAPRALATLESDVQEFEASAVFIDNASDVFNGNEIVRAQVRAFVRKLQKACGACGVVLLAHVDKASAKNPETSQGYSGSTAWNNSVRARWYLFPVDDGSLVLELQKSNYGKAGEKFAVAYDDVQGVFTIEASSDADAQAEVRILCAMYRLAQKGISLPTSKTAPQPAHKSLVQEEALPKKTSAGACEDVLMRLHGQGWVTKELRTAANRSQREYWSLTPKGEAAAKAHLPKFEVGAR